MQMAVPRTGTRDVRVIIVILTPLIFGMTYRFHFGRCQKTQTITLQKPEKLVAKLLLAVPIPETMCLIRLVEVGQQPSLRPELVTSVLVNRSQPGILFMGIKAFGNGETGHFDSGL